LEFLIYNCNSIIISNKLSLIKKKTVKETPQLTEENKTELGLTEEQFKNLNETLKKTLKETSVGGFELNSGVLVLYITLVIVLGLALWYSLSLGSSYTTFASSLVTALTTIAGFAVGVNSHTATT
jgi:hypothetical protein